MTGDKGTSAVAAAHQLVVTRLDDVAADVRARVEVTVRRHGISYDQWRVLHALAEAGAQSMRLLRESTRITGPTLTRVVDRLATMAMVYRDVDATDRRRVLVHLAERGVDLHRTVHRDVAEVEAGALDLLSETERDLLTTLLARLRPNAEGAARAAAARSSS